MWGDVAYVSARGRFNNSAEIRQFLFSIPATSSTTFRTWSYNGGTNAAGENVAGGGIDGQLSLYDSAGLVAQNDNLGGFNLDARINQNLAAGDYTLQLNTSSAGIGDGHWSTDLVNNSRSLTVQGMPGLGVIDFLSLGATGSATAAVNATSDFNVSSVARINSGGRLNLSSTFVAPSCLVYCRTGGEVNLTGGRFDPGMTLVQGGRLTQTGSTVSTSGFGTLLTVEDGGTATLEGGYTFNNRVEVLNGGVVSAYVTHIGVNGTGSLRVDGPGSQFSNRITPDMGKGTTGNAAVTFDHGGVGTFGGLFAGESGGTSQISVLNGATLNVLGAASFAVDPGATLTISNGTVRCDDLRLNGAAALNGGTLQLGTLRSSVSPPPLLDWSAGTVAVGTSLLITPGAPVLGGVIELTAGKTLVVPETATISGGRLIIAGGQAFVGAIERSVTGLVILSAGTLSITEGLSVGAGGDPFGTGLNYSGATLRVTGPLQVFATGSVNVSGGSLIVGSAATAARINLTGSFADFGAGLTNNSTLNVTESIVAGPVTGGPTSAINVAGHSVFAPGASKAHKTHALNVAGQLDITDNAFVVDYDGSPSAAEPFNTVRNQIISARNGGTWDGDGITSSLANATTFAIGYARANALFGIFPATFHGQSIDVSSVLFSFTRYGDANLDGLVNVSDLGALATNWQTSNAVWTSGDFNYDGFVDVTDLGLLATNWQAGVSGSSNSISLESALASVGLGGVNVPEPVVGGLLGFVPMFIRFRRPMHIGRQRVGFKRGGVL